MTEILLLLILVQNSYCYVTTVTVLSDLLAQFLGLLDEPHPPWLLFQKMNSTSLIVRSSKVNPVYNKIPKSYSSLV